jgi:hypothetical protein
LDLLIDLLLRREKVTGDDIREVVEGAAHPEDLAKRSVEAGAAML